MKYTNEELLAEMNQETDIHKKEMLRELLIKTNYKLITYVISKYFNNISGICHKYKIEFDDLMSEGSIGLFKAIDKFDRSKNIKFVSFASLCIRNEILLLLRRMSPKLNVIPYDNFVNDADDQFSCLEFIPDPNSGIDNFVDRYYHFQLLHLLFNSLTKRQLEVFDMYYYKYLTGAEIGEKFGIAQSYVSRILCGIYNKAKILNANMLNNTCCLTYKKRIPYHHNLNISSTMENILKGIYSEMI